MNIPTIFVTGLAGFSGGLIISLLGYAKNKLKNSKEKWNTNKFLLTILIYSLTGFLAGIFEQDIFKALVAGLAVDKLVKLKL
jgi:hypothetical protein